MQPTPLITVHMFAALAGTAVGAVAPVGAPQRPAPARGCTAWPAMPGCC